jgi:hypothetical protein
MKSESQRVLEEALERISKRYDRVHAHCPGGCPTAGAIFTNPAVKWAEKQVDKAVLAEKFGRDLAKPLRTYYDMILAAGGFHPCGEHLTPPERAE